MVKNCRKRGEYNYSCAEKRGKSEIGAGAMFPAAGKGERRSLRGSARLSSKMSGKLPRLRVLRPRQQHQRRARTTESVAIVDAATSATPRPEGNLKGAVASHEVEHDAKKNDARKGEDTFASGAVTADTAVSEMDEDDNDSELTMTAVDEEATTSLDGNIDIDVDVDVAVAVNSEETINIDTNERASYECKTCKPPKMLSSIKAYFEHLRKDHKYKWNLDRHMRNHGGGGAFKCRACNFTADIRQSLTVHESYHHDPPVGQINKNNNDFERKPRNSPRRYNQVGASDFREALNKSGSTTTSAASSDSFVSDHSLISIDDKKSALANAECIALKCEEKGCQFITAWDSEMQRHLAECHAPVISSKPRKPLPMLIPLSLASIKSNNTFNNSGPSTTLLKVPRVRVRPELAQIAKETELAKMYGNKGAANSKRNLNTVTGVFERKNASFFDKLKEKLTTTATSINNSVPEVAVSNENDLKCWCTFKASSMEELTCHKQTHHTALSVSVGTTRCPKCRRRCKSTIDLQTHMQCCHSRDDTAPSIDSSLEKVTNRSDIRMISYRDEFSFPSQMEWDTNLRGSNFSGPPFEGGPTHPSKRRVFKCPHCPFWASTASRFHVHIVGHLNRKPFECSMCAYRSNWRWDITKHIKLKAAKDAVHTRARVLMTDETGRRNYSKYNKYLAQVEQQSWDEDCMEQRSIEEANSEELSSKLLIVGNKEYVPMTSSAPQSPITILSTNETNQNSHTVDRRPPPPLKAAVRNRGQSLLKNNPITMHVQTSSGGGAVSISTAVDESKRTQNQWRCKRCNYRDSNKDDILLHVKSHYESANQESVEERNPFSCEECPFSASDAATLSIHKKHHRPNLDAIFKCYLCPYYVSTKAELLEHARLHGEELAAMHQQNMDFPLSSPKSKQPQISISEGSTSRTKDESSIEQVIQITSRNNVTTSPKITGSQPHSLPSLLLDTRALPDAPLVWVSRPDGTLTKMLKCRHCPYISSRRAEVSDHETMHVDMPTQGPLIACTDCSFTCTRREVMIAHTEMHAGSLGTVHCLFDETRPDSQQVSDLVTLLGLSHTPMLGTEPDLQDSRLVHCCGKCPARFLCEKELRIHLRYHTTLLAYSCQWCSYAARQTAHLLAHQKAHSSEYQERTKYLLTLYGHSQRYPPPTTACVEVESRENNDNALNVAWIVVEINENSNSYNSVNGTTESVQRTGQVFTCAKCPARYFKLDALEYHMTLHGSNNRYKCNDCDYSSKTEQNLLKHQVVHRRHNETSQATAELSSTVDSASTSSPGSPLQSPPDPQFGVFMRGNPNFVYPGYLRNGRLKEKRYKCHKCPSAFEKREQYRVHLTLHGAKQRYRCTTCDYSVKYYANYVQHLKKHQANAEAQASRRQFEDDRISIDSDSITDIISASSRKSSRSSAAANMTAFSSANNMSNNNAALQPSNQDRQSLLLMQKKGIIPSTGDTDIETIRCQSCPFSTIDKDVMDSHKRRHGIERMTPPCPHCDYIPRKDENVGEHIKLHFTRLYKPESYLIVEMLTLTTEKISANNKNDRGQRLKELLFKECADGRFLPLTETINTYTLGTSSSKVKTAKEKIIIDSNTGETKHRLAT
ncbi:PREDICTED: zinc finger protein 91-like isoform X3 [Trachymyrmex septentrionalis]|uniref:zinc finger protein 91-like isoform X3 n=1 Tax=Trachymyrmex septentrionalis TaxID=34720 RepID=UPI00084F208E|nr:PREDICTED: zinc finger protein 91-like isoform X3 [Trachymyrmex septentrionalis]